MVIQTYQPEHYSIVHAAAQDYEGFYEEEIMYRRLLSYPPAAHILAVQIGASEEAAGAALAKRLSLLAGDLPEGSFLIGPAGAGPAPASIGKINDVFRFVIYIKSPDYDLLIRIKDRMEKNLKEQEDRDGRGKMVQFDFDPMNPF